MAGAAMNKNVTFLIATLALTACNPSSEQAPLSQAPLAGAAIGGPFTLTDQDGKQRSYAEFDGKYRIVYFGYTFCPDVCPLDNTRNADAIDLLESRGYDVTPVFITVDPTRDTQALLADYAENFEGLLALTGSQAQTDAAAKTWRAC